MRRDLFEKCPFCQGDRINVNGGTCRHCSGEGYIAIGLTAAQVDRLVREERQRKGDPAAPGVEGGGS